MREQQIVDLITADYSWEQVIYQIVAWEGLDPWDLDIRALSASFLQYVGRLEELDFRIPAKYVIIASVLLRMKSDHLRFLDVLQQLDAPDEPAAEDLNGAAPETPHGGFELNPITLPRARYPRRKITVNELVEALRKALTTQEKRDVRHRRRRQDIQIRQEEDITQRIENLYSRITDLLAQLKDTEMTFSDLVGTWERKKVISTFLPLVYLDHHKKIQYRQENIFDEIYIKKR